MRNEIKCGNCKSFVQHYIKNGDEYDICAYGQCVFGKKARLMSAKNGRVCENFEYS